MEYLATKRQQGKLTKVSFDLIKSDKEYNEEELSNMTKVFINFVS